MTTDRSSSRPPAQHPTPPPFRPSKRLGQNFLVDPNIVRKIVTVAALHPHDVVFEIGPGRGALTRVLCERVSRVIAVELDRRLVDELSADRVGDDGTLTLHHGDALTFAYDTLPLGTVVIANLPYAVSSPLLFRLFRARAQINRMVVMVQREVAERMTAAPGSRDYGILSVMCQYYTTPRKAFTVPSSCFRPAPDVDSAVVCLAVRDGTAPDERVDRAFTTVVRGAFAHRRKTLMNSYRDEGWDPAVLQRAMAHTGIDPRRRAETLTVREFLDLAHAVGDAIVDAPATDGDTSSTKR